MITPAGAVTTLAGTAGVTGSTDATGAAAAFNQPAGIVVDADGNVYVADTGNNAIRKISPGGAVRTIVGQAGHQGFTPGALPGVLSQPVGLALVGRTLYTTTNNAIVQVNNIP
jgi:streptogramin lyase